MASVERQERKLQVCVDFQGHRAGQHGSVFDVAGAKYASLTEYQH